MSKTRGKCEICDCAACAPSKKDRDVCALCGHHVLDHKARGKVPC